ncbi:MAG: hypothetical protein ACI8TX_001696 [Hyphomicrobiaceae bacterium]|jgi:hypothetical protein
MVIPRYRLACLAMLASSLLCVASIANAEPASPGEFLGVGSCASTVCHGSVVHRAGTTIAQNEYLVWFERDAHRSAWKTLESDRSARIAKNLGLGDARTANLCLNCHATNAPEANRGEKFDIVDGVQCESCHGPAGGWIDSHDDPGVTHADSVSRGLTALAAPRERAGVCLSCHVGGDDGFISHRIMAAGHPRTDFELDTFTFLQPAHFVDDADYAERKQAYDSARSWAAGQAAAVLRGLDVLARNAAASSWPEFALYDCFDCHHDIGSRADGGSGTGDALGYPGLDRSNWTLYLALLEAIDPSVAAELRRDLDGLDRLARRGASLASAARAMAVRVEGTNNKIDAWRPNEQALRTTLARLAASATTARIRTYSDAEQATMAVQALAAALAARRTAGGDPSEAVPALDRLFELTARESGFDRERFRRALASVAAAR